MSACAGQLPAATSTPRAPQPGPREPLPHDIVATSARAFRAQASYGPLSDAELWHELGAARAVCLGEEHPDPVHHYVQTQLISGMAQRAAESKPQGASATLGVGFEMFQRPFQSALTAFARSQMTENDFLVGTEYKERWGFDFALYRPILELTQKYGLAALALNARKEVTRQIGREGLTALTPELRQELPELDLSVGSHREFFDHAMGEHPMPKGGPSIDNLYAAQVTWDETMADTAAAWLDQTGPSARLAIVAGSGHCHRSAIPARIARRTSGPVLSVNIVRQAQLPEASASLYDMTVVADD